jgi:hypothetical protein
MEHKRRFAIPKTSQSSVWQRALLIVFLGGVALIGVLFSTFEIHKLTKDGIPEKQVPSKNPSIAELPEPFPLSVNPLKKQIVENAQVDTYFEEHIDSRPIAERSQRGWFSRAVAILARAGWYQNLASPVSRTLVIESGERSEQVAQNFADILKWDDVAKARFVEWIASSTPHISEGKFYPALYVVGRGATVDDVAPLVTKRFENEVLARYNEQIKEIVPLQDALTIASLLEREAYDFDDMRQISGVIWNRLFIDMPLQIDATLQYAKGSKPTEPWWPKVIPTDKFIDSPFNTYQNKGLPPAPIANPSLNAIVAALNPKKTACYYYFHDKQGGFHCAPTYEEHVALLKQHYGRGR